MASFLSLKLLLKCIDFLSWPVLALGYPLFQYWHYMKLMIVLFLVIPDFGRASLIYSQLIQLCICTNLYVVISKFRNWKRVFVEKEDFLMLAEKYITENGAEALEKLMASKNKEQNLDAETKNAVPITEKSEMQQNPAQNLDTETRKVVPTIEKNEGQQTNKVRLPFEQKGIKVWEMIEKEEVPDGKRLALKFGSFLVFSSCKEE
ncbi:HVA22-like protein a [Prosopis cineraria]|uniref:HVA22-like protein a n=1 Tax=Prosopis cineraria TaxID=364024 RepID=UPI00240FFE8E|nr:HVA22-like protein a [Prosopis cineraria]